MKHALALILSLASPLLAEVKITRVDAMTRVLRVQEITDHDAAIEAARGEWESLQIVLTGTIDADATNALPVLRASDRPPSMPPMGDTHPGMAGLSGSGSLTALPAGHISSGTWGINPSSAPSGSSWQTPNTSYASVNVSPPPKRHPAWVVAAGAALVLGGIGIGAVLAARARTDTSGFTRPSQASPPQASPPGADTAAANVASTPPLSDTSTAATDTPSISVDALPGAAKSGAPLPKGSGRLSLAASPGGCMITVDGKERGATPVAALDLPAGVHQILCKPTAGKLRTATVTIQDGATSKYRFALDD